MKTPVSDFVNEYADKNMVRAHMPGHKGVAPLNCSFGNAYKYDITEIKGADALFECDGIIAESEHNTAKLFGTKRTLYSAGGSTLCIQTMLALTCKSGDTVIATRNAHRSFINTCALLDLSPVWVYPEYENGSVVSGTITKEGIENAILSCSYKNISASAVYITSPDYLGKIADVKGIAEVCHKYDVPLLVDNAHGAHLAFLETNQHPSVMGADICCDSAHKSLPVLTGGAYLHIMNDKYIEKAKDCMALFASTSPSYLILQSLDLCCDYLDTRFRKELSFTVKRLDKLKDNIKGIYNVCETEPLKLTLYTLPYGYYGYDFADIMRQYGIECEYADTSHIVMMFSTSTDENDFARVETALKSIEKKSAIPLSCVDFPVLEQAVSVRTAMLSDSETVSIENAVGRICAKSATVCPPCIPVAVSGEVINKKCINIFKNYSILEVNVLK